MAVGSRLGFFPRPDVGTCLTLSAVGGAARQRRHALVRQGDATLSQASLVRVQTRSEPRMHFFGSIKGIIETRGAGALRRGERIDNVLGRAAENAERVALN